MNGQDYNKANMAALANNIPPSSEKVQSSIESIKPVRMHSSSRDFEKGTI